MRKKLCVLVAVLLVGGILLFGVLTRPRAVTTKVVLAGTEGLRVTGSLTADGKDRDVNETLPAEITITARRMSLFVENPDGTESVHAKVLVEGKSRVSGAQRRIRVEVTGDTMFSSSRHSLKAY